MYKLTGEDKDIKDFLEGEMYNQSGTVAPNAAKIQEKAFEQGIITETIEVYQNDDFARATVRGYDVSGKIEDDVSLIHFNSLMQYKLLNLYNKEKEGRKEWVKRHSNKTIEDYIPLWFHDLKAPFEIQSNGQVVPNLTLKGQIKIMEDMLRYKTVAARIVTSQAKARIQKRLLRQDWRDPNEVDVMIEEGRHVGKLKMMEKEERQPKKITNPTNESEMIDNHADMMKKYNPELEARIEQNRVQGHKRIEEQRKKQSQKDPNKPTITGSVKQVPAEEPLEPLYLKEDFEGIEEDKLAMAIIERTQEYLEMESGAAEPLQVKKLFKLHSDELNNIKEGLADECMRSFAGK